MPPYFNSVLGGDRLGGQLIHRLLVDRRDNLIELLNRGIASECNLHFSQKLLENRFEDAASRRHLR
jgi:hypothetical protein